MILNLNTNNWNQTQKSTNSMSNVSISFGVKFYNSFFELAYIYGINTDTVKTPMIFVYLIY